MLQQLIVHYDELSVKTRTREIYGRLILAIIIIYYYTSTIFTLSRRLHLNATLVVYNVTHGALCSKSLETMSDKRYQ